MKGKKIYASIGWEIQQIANANEIIMVIKEYLMRERLIG